MNEIELSTTSGLYFGFFCVALGAKEEGILAGVSTKRNETHHTAS